MSKNKTFLFLVMGLIMGTAVIGVGVSFYLFKDSSNSNTEVGSNFWGQKNRHRETKNNTSNNSNTSDNGEAEYNGSQPLYLTTMTHLENNWDLSSNQPLFNKTVDELRYGMDLAEKYGALLTFESGLSFTEAINKFNDNVLQEAIDRGHGVGTHVDLSAKKKLTDIAATQEVKIHVDAVSALVGAENNLVCSGISGASDWYVAAKNGGCQAIDGVVGLAYLAMPLENRPDGWTDSLIFEEKFHNPAPLGDVRFYPFWINSSEDFNEDSDGDILLSSGETFSLAMFSEAGERNGSRPECEEDCPLTSDDVDVVIADLKDFAASRDSSKIAKYNVYFPTKLFVSENEEVLKKFFSEIQNLAEQGIIQWATQKQVYQAKVAEKE